MTRFFNNEAVSLEEMIKANQRSCEQACAGEQCEHLLVLHDTTDFNYKNKSGLYTVQDPDLGPTGYQGSEVGFFLHASLVVKAKSLFPLGISDTFLWNRQFGQPTRQERNYKRLPIEQKESFKWLMNLRTSSELLNDHEQVTHVMDRDGDIYELFAQDRRPGHELLVRQCRHRTIEAEQEKLTEWLNEMKPVGSYELQVSATAHRRKRTAQMQLSFGRVTLKRPVKLAKHYPETITLTVVQLKEYSHSVPAGDQPIHWVLYTTHPVEDVEKAFEVVAWYAARWMIEELFSLLKTKGLDLEESQLETGIGLKKLCVMSAQVALSILQLIKDRNNDHGQKAELIIAKEDLRFVYALILSLEGNTQAQKNPYPTESLAWLAWAVARLGGWKGYKSESPPGPTTMSRGLKRFWQSLEGWKLMADLNNSS